MKFLNQQHRYNWLFLFLSSLLMIGCKSDTTVTVESIADQYVKEIKKDQIIMEDGKVYEMPVTDSTYVYYLVRHAEKDTIPKSDPRLTQQGYDRAAKLYNILKGTRIDAIYSTLYMRTMETVDTLADAKGMKLFPYTPQSFKEVLENVKTNTNFKRILISGHSNTTPVIANYLTDRNHFTSSFDESDYDNFLIVIENSQDDKKLIPVKYKP